MRIGFNQDTIAHRGLTAPETLELARARGLAGVQFLDPAAIDPELSIDRLAAFKKEADKQGLYLEVGIPSPNPVRRSQELDTEIRPAELARRLRRDLEAVAALGCKHARVFVGNRHDRFSVTTRWPDQQVATLEVLRRIAPLLRELGIRLAFETHADFTANELVRFVNAVGQDVAGVTLDTGNLVMRLDDPIEATEKLAPLVLAAHVKDAVLAFTPRGLCWQARPVGTGILPIADILDIVRRCQPEVNLTIELHPQIYDLPIYDRSWMAHFSEVSKESLAAVIRLTAECERRYHLGQLERPEVVEAIPWDQRDLEGLARSVGYLRPIVRLFGNL